MRTALAALAFILALTWAAAAQPVRDDHRDAVAAIADVHAAIAEIVRIENGDQVGRAAYVRAAHRALNALVGRTDSDYVRSDGDPGDGLGTLGHIDRMLDQNGTLRWTPAAQGAKANVLAAAQDLRDAIDEHEMDDYELDLTRTLANLALVMGQPSQDGVLGGLSGALAHTDLGVPAGAARVSGCAVPGNVPTYGVTDGRLMYVALSRRTAATAIPAGLDIRQIVVRGNDVVLYASDGSGNTGVCRTASRLQRTVDVAHVVAPALYTSAQARAGAVVYAAHCLQCHGANLQGTAGPAVAGTDFLKNAKYDGWTLHDVRMTVFENMPFSDPGSLTPKQYADVMAFLLASSCFPAGTKPFPQADTSSLEAIKLAPLAGIKPTNAKLGTCAVK
jgi:mono/diheme cytochrome c family protein